ncbi:MAG: hypothetical protein V3V53_10835 [Bacteroidales bacterium]|jgi:hypothetical protein
MPYFAPEEILDKERLDLRKYYLRWYWWFLKIEYLAFVIIGGVLKF